MMPPFGAVALLATVALASLSAVGSVVASPQDRYARPDPFEASVRTLRDAVRLPPGGARSPALLALIELEDPELRPLFQSLVQRQDRPVMQADAIVGIARAEPSGSIDAFTLRQIENPELRSEVLKSLIGRGLLKPAEINQILRWPEEEKLLPEDRLFLVATLEREGSPWEVSDIESIAETRSSELRALYSLLLLQKGQPASWEEFRAIVGEMEPEARSALLAVLAPAVRTYQLKGAIAPLLRLAADRDIDSNVRAAIIGSALDLDLPAGLVALRHEVDLDRSPPNLLRYTLMLLMVAEDEGVSAETFAPLSGSENKEIDLLIAAGRCAHGGPECAETFKRVIDLGLRPAAEWCMERTKIIAQTDPEFGRVVMNHVLDLAAQARDPREPILMLAVNAAKELVSLDPDGLRQRLETPSTPPSIQEAVALALVDAANTQATAERRQASAALAASIRGKLPRRFDSMAMLAIARAGGAISAADIDQLGVIGAGGGRVDEAIQIQAAWLHLKALGRHREALARIAPE